MEIFELYDSARGSAETQREMTDEEADVRNEDLRAKQDSRRWIVYDCLGYSFSLFPDNSEKLLMRRT